MEFTVKSGNPEKQRTACLVLGVYESRRLTPPAEQFDSACGGYLGNLLRRGDLEGKPGQSLLLFNVPEALCERVLLVGCGREREVDDRRFRQILTHTATALNDIGATEATVYLTDLAVKGRDLGWKIRQTIEAVEEALYRFDALKSKKDAPRRPLRRIILSVPGRRELPGAEQAFGKAPPLPPASSSPRIWATCRLISALRPGWPNRPRRWLENFRRCMCKFWKKPSWSRWGCRHCWR